LLYTRKAGNNIYRGLSFAAGLEALLLMGRLTKGSQTEEFALLLIKEN
jgi:hypothetical protein